MSKNRYMKDFFRLTKQKIVIILVLTAIMFFFVWRTQPVCLGVRMCPADADTPGATMKSDGNYYYAGKNVLFSCSSACSTSEYLTQTLIILAYYLIPMLIINYFIACIVCGIINRKKGG